MQNPRVQELVHDQRSSVIDKAERLRDVALRFLTSDCDLFAVTDNCGRLLGVITESAVVRSLLANPAPTTTIETCVSTNVDSVRSTATLNSVLHLFRTSCHTAIPVVDPQDRVCGLLLRRDVMAAMLNDTGTTKDTAPSVNTNNGSTGNKIVPPGPVIQDPQGVRLKFEGARLDSAEDSRFPKTPNARQVREGAESTDSDETRILKGNFGGSDTGNGNADVNGGEVNGNGVNGQVVGASSSDSVPSDPPSAGDSAPGGNTSGPHFLKGEAARRRLNSMIDFRGGFNESPW